MTTSSIAPATSAQAEQIAHGLRQVADFVEANPHLDQRFTFQRILVVADTRDEVAAYARAGLAAGAKVTKHQGDKWAGVDLHFGIVNLHVYADREEVCERIVVGTREVTEEVPDPEALAAVPKITKTTIVEDVEWRCGSLLAPEPVKSVPSCRRCDAFLHQDSEGLWVDDAGYQKCTDDEYPHQPGGPPPAAQATTVPQPDGVPGGGR